MHLLYRAFGKIAIAGTAHRSAVDRLDGLHDADLSTRIVRR